MHLKFNSKILLLVKRGKKLVKLLLKQLMKEKKNLKLLPVFIIPLTRLKWRRKIDLGIITSLKEQMN